MGVTYTSGLARDRRQIRRSGVGGAGLLVATSFVALGAIALATAGRLYSLEVTSANVATPDRVNLNDVASAAVLEVPLSRVFEHAVDRQLGAAELFRFLRPQGEPASLANVGAIARVQVPAASIQRRPELVELAERWRTSHDAAVRDGRPAPVSVPLFTSANVLELKPLAVVRTRGEFVRRVIWCAVVFVLAFHLVPVIWRLRGIAGDRQLLALAYLLTSVGFVLVLTRPDPLRDTMLVVRYTQGILAGLAAFVAVSMVNVRTLSSLGLSFVPLAAAVAISVALLLFGSGPGSSGAKVNLGPVQPIEAIRWLLVVFLAGYFARRWEMIRDVRAEVFRGYRLPAWLNLPKANHVIPVTIGLAIALTLFFLQRDLGPALLVSLIFVATLALARGRIGLPVAGLALLAGGVAAGAALGVSSTIVARVGMWQSPWDNAVRGGDQVAHAAWALARGGAAGTGLGLGDTRYVPEAHTDLVLAAAGEELGIVGLFVVAAAFVLLARRGFQIARRAPDDYTYFLAVTMTLSLVVPVLVMAAGTLGVTPLTGVVTPFLSYGGSAMVANFAALGLLSAIHSDRRGGGEFAAFATPMRWLRTSLAVCAVALFALLVDRQVVRADTLLVKPQLGAQADGGRRYQYNPRVLDALRSIPRGTIYDRRGLPLASGDPAVIQTSAAEYDRVGVQVGDICRETTARCYPAGPSLFHLLGDDRTRLNWTASNTSYVERDTEDLLRGFEDRAVVVATADVHGRPMTTVKRDYRPLVPLLRHRYEPRHPDVQALLARARDVRLTIDVRLQLDAAAIVARAASRTKSGRAAAVVVDAVTGEILAIVSYPWPEPGRQSAKALELDPALDRARYGLYPPGSTFKIVTAAAAFRDDLATPRSMFTCARLPDGRVGAAIPGFARPIRDDVRDSHPHGRLDLGGAMAQSCNAYFAQLAVAVGADGMRATAGAAGIALSASETPARVRANLPHAGYGQGEVLVTPLRMARVVAAVASDGMLREMPIVGGIARETAFLPAPAARELAGYLREAVTRGTGRLLKDHPNRIAGKTGTAEIDEADSHAWFVGYAPAGPAPRRLAFAVILEHAGYGGAAAASVAGELVTAAASAGLIR